MRTRRQPIRAWALVAVVLLGGCAEEGADADVEPGGVADLVMPPGPDVWVADLHWEQTGPPGIGDPVNVTRRNGYDNQPHFVPDGSGFWYTAIDEMVGQADIWRYDIESAMVERVTASSPESEYSATPLPDGSGVSVIRVEADSTQRLWRFDHDGGNAAVLVEDVAPVGYHAWSGPTTVVAFVLGSPPTLQRIDVTTGAAEVITDDIGRSIQSIPGSDDVSFVQRNEDGTTTVMRLSPDSARPTPIIEGVGGGDFHAWAHDGTLFMAEGASIHAFTAGVTDGWTAVADFSRFRILISRLAVSPDGSRIAMVAEPTF